MKRIVDNVNTLELTFKTLDLAGRVPFMDSIELLGVELQYHEGRGPLFMGRVRYAIDGVKQEEGFPLDLHKGAFRNPKIRAIRLICENPWFRQ